MNPHSHDWELEEIFGLWNNAGQATEDLIQTARTHRAMMILNKVYKAFFHCEDFVNWAYKLHIPHTFLLALKIEFERGLHLHDEGCGTDANFDLSQPMKKTTCIYAVTALAETFFSSTGRILYMSQQP